MRFTVLGPVRAWRGEAEADLGGPQQRALLALLLAAGGRPVGLAGIVDALWGEDPPASAVNVIYRYVGGLRRLIEPDLPTRDAGRFLLASAGGYRLEVTADSLDLLRFRELAERGRAESSPEWYAQGLELWQGPAAAGIGATVRGHPMFAALDREHLAAAQAAADLALATGAADRLLPAVRFAADLAPLDESMQARLVLRLGAAGQQAAALGAYRRIATRLVDELGIDPGEELTAARDTVLRGTSSPVSAPAPAGDLSDRPAQLPVDLAMFAGRQRELASAMALLTDEAAETVVISAIGGMAGVGKTALAVHWAHQVADRYPDGQLYVNLRGFDPDNEVLAPSEALRRLLGALGVQHEAIPARLDALAAIYRTRIAGRRMLVLLDNARDVEQVRPLLPASRGCLVIVTSRNQLSGLVALDGARPLSLDVLSAADGRDLLIRRIGAARVGAEPAAVEEIVARCANLPLALAIVAARAGIRPDFPLEAVAAELSEAHGSLDAFAGPEDAVNVRAVFSWSYRALTDPAARMFRLLGVHPGPDITAVAAASLAGIRRGQARLLLGELTRAHLLAEHRPGRYACHDLLRAYAIELADDPEEQLAARHRMLDHYLYSALPGHNLLSPHRRPIELTSMSDGVTPEQPADEPEAIAWFTAEEPVLLAAITQAARHRFDRHAWQLHWTAHPYLNRRVASDTALAAMRTAADATHRLADSANHARILANIANHHAQTDQHDLATDCFQQALLLYQESGDLAGQADVYHGMAAMTDRQGECRETLRYTRRALEIYRRIGSRFGEAMALGGIAWAYARLGEYRRALARCRQSLAVDGGHADHTAGGTWHTIGYAKHCLGDYRAAVDAFRRAIDFVAIVGDSRLESLFYVDLGEAQHACGDVEAARTSWERAAALLDDIDRRRAGEIRAKSIMDSRPYAG